jgi:hypothetical protein
MDFHLLLVRAVNPMNKFIIDDVVGWKWGGELRKLVRLAGQLQTRLLCP